MTASLVIRSTGRYFAVEANPPSPQLAIGLFGDWRSARCTADAIARLLGWPIADATPMHRRAGSADGLPPAWMPAMVDWGDE